MNQDIVQLSKIMKNIIETTIDIVSRGVYINTIYDLVFASIIFIGLCYVVYFITKNKARLTDKIGDVINPIIFVSYLILTVYIVVFLLSLPDTITCLSNTEYCAIKMLFGK
jgi:branched-subunit amino acid permease